MSIEYTLICDVCAHIIDAGTETAAHVRATAKAQGTAVRRKRADLCASCAEAAGVRVVRVE